MSKEILMLNVMKSADLSLRQIGGRGVGVAKSEIAT